MTGEGAHEPGEPAEVTTPRNITLGEVYSATQAARQAWRTLAWQVPALALTAQAVLVAVIADPSTSPGARFGASALALVIIVVALQLFVRHCYHAHISEVWVSLVETDSDFPGVSSRHSFEQILEKRGIPRSEIECDPRGRREIVFVWPFSWLRRRRSRTLWAWTLALLVVADAVLVLGTAIAWA